MTVGEILTAAMHELDEDPADLNEHRARFMLYLNTGYQTILRKYYRPRETLCMHTDEDGWLNLYGHDVEQVLSIRDHRGRHVSFTPCDDDSGDVEIGLRDADVYVLCQVNCPPLGDITDEPKLPEHAHYALVLYICWKHLQSGNLAKQSRAQVYMNGFYEVMNMLQPMGTGSVKTYTNFYAATN